MACFSRPSSSKAAPDHESPVLNRWDDVSTLVCDALFMPDVALCVLPKQLEHGFISLQDIFPVALSSGVQKCFFYLKQQPSS